MLLLLGGSEVVKVFVVGADSSSFATIFFYSCSPSMGAKFQSDSVTTWIFFKRSKHFNQYLLCIG
jgi:hypothetical protein